LRDYAEQIGLDPGFTIHDREDSGDLMNLVRHQLGLSKTESRFPAKGTCLAIYSRAVNAELPLGDVLGGFYPWCAGWDPISALAEIPAPPRSGADWHAFVEMLRQLHIGTAAWPAEIEYARHWYQPHLERIHEDAGVRQADLVQLEQIAAGYPSRE
jgi:hypothetical protein